MGLLGLNQPAAPILIPPDWTLQMTQPFPIYNLCGLRIFDLVCIFVFGQEKSLIDYAKFELLIAIVL